MLGATQETHKHEVKKPFKKGILAAEHDGKQVSLTFRVFTQLREGCVRRRTTARGTPLAEYEGKRVSLTCRVFA
jgi:hypothetical protein